MLVLVNWPRKLSGLAASDSREQTKGSYSDKEAGTRGMHSWVYAELEFSWGPCGPTLPTSEEPAMERAGLRINANCQVIDINGQVIPGLYCGGESAGGFSLHGLARATCQGYIAGHHAVLA